MCCEEKHTVTIIMLYNIGTVIQTGFINFILLIKSQFTSIYLLIFFLFWSFTFIFNWLLSKPKAFTRSQSSISLFVTSTMNADEQKAACVYPVSYVVFGTFRRLGENIFYVISVFDDKVSGSVISVRFRRSCAIFFLVFTLIRGVTQFLFALGISANTRFPLPRWLIKVFHYLDKLDMYIIECMLKVQYFLDTDRDNVEWSMMIFLMA